MVQMRPKNELTSSEAAVLLDVHPSTVKRWCNDGELDSAVTPGGHRRIRVDRAVEFARERGIRTILTPFSPYAPHVWTALSRIRERGSFEALHALALQWAKRGEFERLEQLIIALGRSGDVPFWLLCDEGVRGLMQAVGREWQAGRMRVGDEHMVSQAILGALSALRRGWMDDRGGNGSARRPIAVVGSLEDNQHELGALCTRILLEREGWTVFYPGRDVPIEDFAIIQRSREASLVCVSLPPTATLGDVTRHVSLLAQLYDRSRSYRLVLGGSSVRHLDPSDIPHPFEALSLLGDARALHLALRRDFDRQHTADASHNQEAP